MGAFSMTDIKNHYKVPSQNSNAVYARPVVLPMGYVDIYCRQSHIKIHAHIRNMRENMFLLGSRIRLELIRRVGRRVFVRMVQRHFVATEYHSGDPDRCPRVTLYHHSCHSLQAYGLQDWKRQHWPHVILVDESGVNLYNRNGHARVIRRGFWKVSRLLHARMRTIRVVAVYVLW